MTTDHHENTPQEPSALLQEHDRRIKATHRLMFDKREGLYKPAKIPQYERSDL